MKGKLIGYTSSDLIRLARIIYTMSTQIYLNVFNIFLKISLYITFGAYIVTDSSNSRKVPAIISIILLIDIVHCSAVCIILMPHWLALNGI